MKIGVIGLGRMGVGIAENLLRAGHQVTVWNRSPEPATRLVEQGAIAAKAPGEACNGEILFSMLASDAAMRAIGLDDALLQKAAPGLVHVNMATISTAFARELTMTHARHGLAYISAPVFGRPDVAASGQLLLVAGGPSATIAKIQPVLDTIGRRTLHVGEEAEKANLFKIAGNFLIASEMEAIGEAFALLRKGGVDHALFHEVMAERLFSGLIFQNYGKAMLNPSDEPAGFALQLGLKDTNLAREAAQDLSLTMPLAEVVAAHFESAMQLGWAQKDWSALGEVIARQAGLKP